MAEDGESLQKRAFLLGNRNIQVAKCETLAAFLHDPKTQEPHVRMIRPQGLIHCRESMSLTWQLSPAEGCCKLLMKSDFKTLRQGAQPGVLAAQISHVATAVTAVAAQHVSRNIKPLSVASLLSWSIMTLCGFTLGLPKLDF